MKKKCVLFLFFISSIFSNESKQTVCLNMIVKDEKEVIKNCLESVKGFIDYWVIVDTGSSDNTKEIIKECLKDIPGDLYDCPWVNFAYNRNVALSLAKGKSDYILFMDADDCLSFSEGFVKPQLKADGYLVEIHCGCVRYYRNLLVKNNLNWKWVGPVHEVLICDNMTKSDTLQNVVCKAGVHGSRSYDPKKYQKDAELLEEELKKNPRETRYRFYLAQSYRDAQKPLLALENYRKRVAMGGWDEEVFISLYQIARIEQEENLDPQTFLEDYLKAYIFRPSRIEPLYYIANYYRRKGDYQLGYNFAKIGEKISKSTDVLFVEDWIYTYGLLLELSICAYWVGEFLESKEISEKIYATPNLAQNIYDCVLRNKGCAEEQLKKNNEEK